MNWQLTVAISVLGTLVFIVFVIWYQPEARHAPFVAGQVWKNSAGFTIKIVTVHGDSLGKDFPHRSLTLKRTTPEGEYYMLDHYPAYALRRLIIKNRYRLV